MENLIIKVGVAPEASLLGVGGKPIFYRLTYDEIKDNPYDVCGKRAVMASLEGHVPAKGFNLHEYSITYVYTDADGDDMLIDSEAGLLAAMAEAKDSSKLKLLASVKEVGGDSMAEVGGAPAANKPSAAMLIKQRAFVLGPNQPFIHGRHQCSGCLDMPIIGTRFRGVGNDGAAMDLCETCKEEFAGDVKFEAVELCADLDRQKQFRRLHRFKYRAVVNELKEQRQGNSKGKKLARAAAKAGREMNAKTAGKEAPVVVQADRVEDIDKVMTLRELRVKAKRLHLRQLVKQARDEMPGGHQLAGGGAVPTLGEIKAKRQHLRQLVQARAKAMHTDTKEAPTEKVGVAEDDWQIVKSTCATNRLLM